MSVVPRASVVVLCGAGSVDGSLALRTCLLGVYVPTAIHAEHRLDPSVETRLTEVVLRLRDSWLSSCALQWSDVHSVHEVARNDLEKRIAATLSNGFFEFSQLLCGLEVLLLQSQKLSVVREQPLLGLEQRAQARQG